MHTRQSDYHSRASSDPLIRAEGGFVTDTEVITPAGPQRVDTLRPGDTVCALNPERGLLKEKPIATVERVHPQEPLVGIQSRRVDFRVAAGHPLYYTTKTVDEPSLVTARNLPEKVYYRFPYDWRTRSGERLGTVDLTDLTSQYQARVHYDGHGSTFRSALPEGCVPCRGHGHTGYYFDAAAFKRYQDTLERQATAVEICSGPNSRGRPYQFDGDDFLALLGWFITEGSLTSYPDRNTVQIGFAQKDPDGRASLRALFDRMGLNVSSSSSGFSFSSAAYADVFERLCGATSTARHLPWFVWDLCFAQQRLLLDTLIAGDGNAEGRYYTASEDLAGDVLRLVAHLGLKPQYRHRRGTWCISTADMRDGIRSDTNVAWLPPAGPLVRLAVTDYPAVLAGRNGHFQWIGVSGIG